MKKIVFVFIFLSAFFQADAQILISQSFDATTFPPTGWTSSPGGTSVPQAAWTRIANGANPGNTPHSGAGQLKLNGYDAANGTAALITPALSFAYPSGFIQVSVWIYRENTYPGAAYAAEGVSVLTNTTASATGATSLGFIPRNRSTVPTATADGWYQYFFTVPSTINGATNYVIFAGTSRYGSNFYIDDIEISHLEPCSGTPNAGAAYATDSLCAATPVVLNDTSIGLSGVTYQWQSAAAGSGAWTNIPGATTVPYTLNAGITAATDFRLAVTCTTSALTGFSSAAQVGVKPFYNCYCNSSSTFSEDNIGQVTIGSSFANPATAPSPLTANPASTARYTDFTGLGAVNVVPGGSMPFTVTQMNQNSYWFCGLAVFGDFNHNSSFGDPGETVFGPATGPAAPSAPTWTGTLAIPATARPGITRLRFVMIERATSVAPCGTFNWGETEDYLVNVISAMPPAPTLATTAPVCEGQLLRITASIPVYYPNPVYTLTGPGINTLSSTTGVFDIPAACANNGTFSVTVTSQNLTSSASSIAVVVNCVPSIVATNAVSPTNCLVNDGQFQLTGLAASTSYTLLYQKSGVTGTVSLPVTADASGVIAVTGLGAGNYAPVTVRTAAGCNSNTISTAVVIPTPVPPATPMIAVNPYPICQGTTVTLSVSNPAQHASYAWSGPSGFTSSGPSITITGFDASSNGTYSVIATIDGCSSAPSNASLSMLTPAPRPVRNNVTYCQFDAPVPMTAQTVSGTFVEWFDTCSGGAGCVNGLRSRGSVPGIPNPPTPNTNVPGIVMWLVRQTGANGCPSAFDSVYARVLPKPLPPTPVNATIQYCQYETVGALSVPGNDVHWFTTPTGGSGTTIAPVPSTGTPGTYHFYASQTSADGCESDRTMLTVVVKPKPQPPTVSSPLNLCQGDAPRQLTAIGQDLRWYTLPNGGAGVQIAPVISTSYEDSFAHYVTQTVNGCESDRALIGSYVRYKPNGIITASAQSVCQDAHDTFSYYGNGRSDADYVWFAPLSTEVIAAKAQSGPVVIRFDTAGTATVQLIVNNKGCISKLLSAPITVRPLPVISYANRQDACEDELVNIGLKATESGISSYQWDFGQDATVVYGEVRTGGPFGVRYLRAGHYAVSASATKNGCTSVPISQDIYVHERPLAAIAFDYRNGRPLDQFCASDTLQLSVQQQPEGGTYVWTPAQYFQGLYDSLNNEVRAVVSMSSFVRVRVKSAFGCEATDSIYVPVKPCCGVFFPNAFTPGSQVAQNRVFRAITSGVHRINSFRVMNRWGQVIWETTQEGAGWDGTFRGVPQDMGTYFYYVNYRCGDKNMEDQGEVILIR